VIEEVNEEVIGETAMPETHGHSAGTLWENRLPSPRGKD